MLKKKSHQLVSGSSFLDTADLLHICQSLQGDQCDALHISVLQNSSFKIGIKEKGLHKTDNEELGMSMCPRSDPYVKKHTTGKLFSRLDF